MRTNFLIVTLCFCMSMTAQEVQLSWQKDFNVATELAKSENKQILIYFTKTDCSPCSQFYTDFFKQDAFKNLSDNFVLLMLDGSNNDNDSTDLAIIKQRRLIMHYNKTFSFPAVLLIDSDRKAIGELFTSTDDTEITSYLNFLQTIK